MGTQTRIAAKIKQTHADYTLAIEKNKKSVMSGIRKRILSMLLAIVVSAAALPAGNAAASVPGYKG